MWETWSPETDDGSWEYLFAPGQTTHLVLAQDVRGQSSPYLTPILVQSPHALIVDGMAYTIACGQLMRREVASRPFLIHIWNKVDELYDLCPRRDDSATARRIGAVLDTLVLSRVQMPRRSVFEQIQQALVMIKRERRRCKSMSPKLFEGLQKIHDLFSLLDFEKE